jgi:hypothetical protein
MEWVVLIAVVLALVSLFSSKSKPQCQSNSIKVADFIPFRKDDEGHWCTYQAGVYCIEEFSKALGAHANALSLYKSEFDRIISEGKSNLRNELIQNDHNFKEHLEHHELLVAQAKDQEELDALNIEIGEVKKSHKKVKNWLEKNLFKFESDCRQPLRKILVAAKSAWNENPEFFHHLDIDYETPELPDKYYY